MNDDIIPAFPINSPSGNPEYMPQRDGMTLRDWFAGQAIATMINKSEDSDGGWDGGSVAAGCYAIADAMLAERKL